MSKLEQKILKEIDLTESLLTRIMKRYFKSTVDRSLKKLVKDLDNDPEFKSALSDLQKHRERIKELRKRLNELVDRGI